MQFAQPNTTNTVADILSRVTKPRFDNEVLRMVNLPILQKWCTRGPDGSEIFELLANWYSNAIEIQLIGKSTPVLDPKLQDVKFGSTNHYLMMNGVDLPVQKISVKRSA